MTAGKALAQALVDEALRRRLWLSCRAVPGLSAERWRYDHAELLMKWDEFGNGESKVGWSLAYSVPLEGGGADHADNLRAATFTALGAGSGAPA